MSTTSLADIAVAEAGWRRSRQNEVMPDRRRTRGLTATSQPALTQPPLAAMLATCTDGLIGVRDRALLLVGWSTGGRRRSELTRLTVEQVMRVEDQLYVFRLSRSKTNQAGNDDDPNAMKPIAGVAALALSAWLKAAHLTTGAIFRRVRATKGGEALTPQAVRCIVQRRARLAGLTDVNYSAHSIRSGFMTEADRSGMYLRDAMALSEHRTVDTAMKYFQPGAALARGVDKLLEGLPAPATDSRSDAHHPPVFISGSRMYHSIKQKVVPTAVRRSIFLVRPLPASACSRHYTRRTASDFHSHRELQWFER